MYLDINGFKKPNLIGKDIFTFMIYLEEENKLTMSMHLTIYTHDINPTAQDLEDAYANNKYWWKIREQSQVESLCINQSNACGTWIMRNGWKIPEHYPWL